MAVVEGATPERVEQATADLAAALRADQRAFRRGRPSGGRAVLRPRMACSISIRTSSPTSADRLAAAQPLLATLADDPSLRGLAAFVELAQAEGDASGALPEELDRLLGADGRGGRGAARRPPGRGVVAPDPAAGRAARPRSGGWWSRSRASISSRWRSRGPAIEALRAHARDQGIDAAHGLELRLTGEATLNQEELQSVRAGATLASVLTTLAVTGAAGLGPGLAAPDRGDPDHARARPDRHRRRSRRSTIGRLNLISVTFAVLFVGLGVDFGIHLVLRYREALEAARRARRGACAARSPGSAVRCR